MRSLPTSARRAATPVACLGALMGALFAGSSPALAAAPVTFNYTGAVQTYTVPANTSHITATAVGARGGNNTVAPIGQGATVSANLPVSAGQQLYVYVGYHGIGGFNGSIGGYNGGGDASPFHAGGAGGGASDIRTAAGDLASRILVAGGGGGPGNGRGMLAAGGSAGQDGQGANVNGTAGRAGSVLAGGAGGDAIGGGLFGQPGSFGQGGDAGYWAGGVFVNGAAGAAGGGGGGGYFGGGGGGPHAGGGGGSNYIDPGAWNTSSALGGINDGQVTITAVPRLLSADDELTFPSTELGDVSRDEVLTVTNTDSEPRTITATMLGGVQAGDFTISSNSCDDATLGVGATCYLRVTFRPQAVGARAGSVTVNSTGDNGGATVTVALSGDATTPAITIDPASYDYGEQSGAVVEHTFTFTNVSSAPKQLFFGTEGPFGTDGSGDNPCLEEPLAAGESCEAPISFLPGAPLGPKTGALVVSWTGRSAPVRVPLTGTAVETPADIRADLDLSDPDFGLLTVGESSDPKTVTVTNEGQKPLNVGQVSFTGADKDDFELVNDGCSNQSVAGDQTCTLDVRFFPVRAGDEKAAELSIPSNATSGTATIPVTGAALPQAPVAAAGIEGSTFTSNMPAVPVTNVDPSASEVWMYDADGFPLGSTAHVNANGTAVVTANQWLPDGTYQLRFVQLVNDMPSLRSAPVTITVDATAPDAPAVTGGPQGTVTSTTGRFEFSGEPAATFECSLDDGAFAPCTSPQSYTGLAAGQHTFRVRQTDTNGHAGAVAEQTFTVAQADTTNLDPDDTTGPAPDATSLTLIVAKTGTVSRGRIPVGCRLDSGQLASCAVTAYAGRRKVGRGSAKHDGGQLGAVKVKLTARGRRLTHRVRGVRLTFREVATTTTGKRLTAKGAARVLPLSAAAVPSDGLFASGSSQLTGYGRRFARSLAGQLDGAKRVRCTGHTDSVGAAGMNQRLGLKRAKALCAQLRRSGVNVKLTVRSLGERDPRASNHTDAGRDLNRRVELRVSYR